MKYKQINLSNLTQLSKKSPLITISMILILIAVIFSLGYQAYSIRQKNIKNKQVVTTPQCLNIDIIDSQTGLIKEDLRKGDTVLFSCTEVSEIDHYIFKITEPDNNHISLNASGRVSLPYTINQDGTYLVECHICKTSDKYSCSPYTSLILN